MLKMFKEKYEEIAQILSNPQMQPLKYLGYDYETLWNYSWGILSFFPLTRIKLFHEGSFQNLQASRLILLFLPKELQVELKERIRMKERGGANDQEEEKMPYGGAGLLA